MRILIYSLNYFPEPTGIGKYNTEMAEWLEAQGHEITIITAPPYYPWWKVQQPYRSCTYQTEMRGKIKIYRCPIWVPRAPSGWKRLLHLSTFALSSLPALFWQLRKRPDVLMVLEPTLFCSPAAVTLARLFSSKTWLHIQDLEIDAGLGLSLVKSKLIGQLALFIERWLLKRFDNISTISDKMLMRVQVKGAAQEKCILFPNWIDTSSIFPLTTASTYRDQLSISHATCVALYSGNFGKKQGLEMIIEAARVLQDQANLIFVLCGEGAERDSLKKMGADLWNIRWLPLQPAEKMNELLNLADIHILPQRADVADLVMPSKLLGMLASGKPILATAHAGTQLEKVISCCGKVVEPGNIQGLVQELLGLMQLPHERKRLGGIARMCAKEWDKEKVLSRFEARLQQLATQ